MAKDDASRAGGDLTNSKLFTRLDRCIICGSDRLEAVMVARDPHYGNLGLFPIHECQDCQAGLLNPMPTLAYLATAYPTTYSVYLITRTTPLKEFIRTALGFVTEATGDPKFAKPGRMVDVGCANGDALAKFRRMGWDTVGVEISEQAAEAARTAHGLDVRVGTLHDAALPDADFDYVRLNHCFEHLINPKEVLAELRRIIKPDGTLFIGVPNRAGWAAKLFGPHWWNLGPPVHPVNYTPVTLRRLLDEGGFKTVRVQYNSNFASWLGSLQIYLNRDNGRSSSDGWVMRNPVFKILAHWGSKIPDLFGKGDCMEIIAKPR